MFLSVDVRSLKAHRDILQQELTVANNLYGLVDKICLQVQMNPCENTSNLHRQRIYVEKEINNIQSRINLLMMIIEKVTNQINEMDEILAEAEHRVKVVDDTLVLME